MRHNLILDVDSYKLSHFNQYPAGVSGLSSYIEARGSDYKSAVEHKYTVFFGLQYFIKKYLLKPITKEDIDEAEVFAKAHGEPFNRAGWEKVLNKYRGVLPITIFAVPEGTRVPLKNALVRVDCYDPDLFWLSSYIETALQRVIWYATTVATNSHGIKKIIKRYLEETADDLSGLEFKLHDFGGRGVSSEETAQIGGAAHLVSFKGSDTISGVRAANFYYNEPMAAFSVPAAEHSTMTAWGRDGEKDAFRNMLKQYGGKFPIVSVVSDAYDIFNAIDLWGELKDEVFKSGSLLVIRPDSGEPVDTVEKVVRRIEKNFGSTSNSKGYKLLNGVRVLQGDGIDGDMIERILFNLKIKGYSADNMVFGSGGALLQKVNRDTYKFAMKASAVYKDGWEGIRKEPITDKGKNSKKGLLGLYRSKMTKEYMTFDSLNSIDDDWVSQFREVYSDGRLFVDDTLKQIRERADNGI